MAVSSEKTTAASKSTFGVDYVISYSFANTEPAKAEEGFQKLILALSDVGLSTEVRIGDETSVLVFTKIASDAHLNAEVYRTRVNDWLHGVRSSAPEKEMKRSLDGEPITEAERLRLIYLLITKPKSEGGAGITPKKGEWENVTTIFALHDHEFNNHWIKEWSKKYFLDQDDLTKIRDEFGEKVGFYFAFLQSYFMFLVFPASFGFASWFLLGQYSVAYALVNCLWCVTFVEYWKKQEIDLAVQWGTRNVSRIQSKRPNFRYEKIGTDPVTGEEIKIYSPLKRLSRQALQIPFALLAIAGLGSLIAGCFGIEIFISEVYDGPFKQYLTFLPTIILTIMTPTLSAILTGFAGRLTDLENYETVGEHEAAMTHKIFVLNFITSYLPIFLTAFVYVPFASVLVPYLDVFKLTVQPFAQDEKQLQIPASFQINPDRLKKQVIYFTVTAQVVNLLLEFVVPYVTRRTKKEVKRVQTNFAAKRSGSPGPAAEDAPQEAEFLKQVRFQAELPPYDVSVDLREMVVQFGYLSLFSVVWPVTAVSFLINNWVEARSDALKITLESQRPIPGRADSIGPWLDSLAFLTWIGSLTTSALVYLFNTSEVGPDGNPHNISPTGLLLTLVFSEHIFFAVQYLVRHCLSKIDSPGLQKERKERYLIRRDFLEANHIKTAADISVGTIEDAKYKSLPPGAPSELKFWACQRGPTETISAGTELIRRAKANETETKKTI